jgi:hypothetical protein
MRSAFRAAGDISQQCREITAFWLLMGRGSLTQTLNHKKIDFELLGTKPMKRSRRVVLTMMGSAAVGAVSMGFARRRPCGPGLEAVPGPNDVRYCRAIHGGFGGAMHHVHGHGGHGHGHAGG